MDWRTWRTSEDQYSTLYVGHEKVTSALFSLSRDIFADEQSYNIGFYYRFHNINEKHNYFRNKKKIMWNFNTDPSDGIKFWEHVRPLFKIFATLES